jgi:hypothetical protein
VVDAMVHGEVALRVGDDVLPVQHGTEVLIATDLDLQTAGAFQPPHPRPQRGAGLPLLAGGDRLGEAAAAGQRRPHRLGAQHARIAAEQEGTGACRARASRLLRVMTFTWTVLAP